MPVLPSSRRSFSSRIRPLPRVDARRATIRRSLRRLDPAPEVLRSTGFVPEQGNDSPKSGEPRSRAARFALVLDSWNCAAIRD